MPKMILQAIQKISLAEKIFFKLHLHEHLFIVRRELSAFPQLRVSPKDLQ